jgi:predicted DNA-binding antitoxin AbrB/MazE fold protein
MGDTSKDPMYRAYVRRRTLAAIFEDGVLKPLEDPGLAEHELVEIEITRKPQEETAPRRQRVPGSAKGLIKMADDLEEELDGGDPGAKLASWHEVYEGLSEDEVTEVEAMALDRSRFSREDPE